MAESIKPAISFGILIFFSENISYIIVDVHPTGLLLKLIGTLVPIAPKL